MRSLANIFRLGLKELRCLFADRVLLILIIWAFSGGVYTAATGMSRELHNAPIAIVDMDHSPLSQRIAGAFYAPYFRPPQAATLAEADAGLDTGRVSFALVVPANFQRDLSAGKRPELQLAIDATNMGQSFIGASYIQHIIAGELNEYLTGTRSTATSPIQLATRVRFNPNLTGFWFGGVMEVINNITLLSIILVGAAFIREREHGTLEHLLVMPLTPLEIMLAKVWANALVVLVAASFGLVVIVQAVMRVPVAGSVPLFLVGAACFLFASASIGIWLGTVARSMPQLGLLIILIVIPLQLLSGGVTPRESMPALVQDIMLGAPTTWFVRFAQAILYRGAGFDVVWPDFLAILAIGAVFFAIALSRFRKAVTQTQL